MIEDTFRLMRWDRSGIIYTEPSNLTDGHLFEFLWRFNHLSPIDRGHDTTASPPDDDEAELALPESEIADLLKVRECAEGTSSHDSCLERSLPRRWA